MLRGDPDAQLSRLRALCLALPETDEVASHGMPAFRVAGKMFAYFRHNHHGDGRTVACLKTGGRDEQDMLIEADPDLFSWPAYLGPSGWIAMNLEPADLDWAHVQARVLASFRLAAPKRLAGVWASPTLVIPVSRTRRPGPIGADASRQSREPRVHGSRTSAARFPG